MLEKIAEILTATTKPTLKTQIIAKCNLNASQGDGYITQLVEAGLLDAFPLLQPRHNNDHRVVSGIAGRPSHHRMIYQTSQKGKEFLKRYNELLTLLETSLKYPPQLISVGAT